MNNVALVKGMCSVNIKDMPAAAEIIADGLAAESLADAVPGPEDAVAARLAELVSPEIVDRMLADAEAAGIALYGPGGLINQLTRPLPGDQNRSFEPEITPKGQRRMAQVDQMILSLYARGMTTRDIQGRLAEAYGADVSLTFVSWVTDVVAEEIAAWQTQPLDAIYPILYINALVTKARDGGVLNDKAAHLVIGVDLDGYEHVLGIWIAAAEGARFWDGVLAELRNRGLKDTLFVCCDGLGGLPEAIGATWPKAIVQTCMIHDADLGTMPIWRRDSLVGWCWRRERRHSPGWLMDAFFVD